MINFSRSADPKTNFERRHTKFERISSLENSILIYRLILKISECVNRVASVSLGIIYTASYMASAFLICFLFSKGDGGEKMLALGFLALLLSTMTINLSFAGNIYALSISLCLEWKRNLRENCGKMTKIRFKGFQWLLKSLRPIQIELGDCWHLDQQAIIPFYETILDKIVLLTNVFPSLKSVK